MDALDKLGLACVLWSVLLAICNPWFKNRYMAGASVLLLLVATVTWVMRP